MSLSTAKKAGIGLGLLFIICLAAYFIFVPKWEKEQIKNIEALLAALPGNVKAEKIEVSALSQSVTLINVSGAVQESLLEDQEAEYTFRADKIELSDINYNAAEINAVTKLVDSVKLTNLTVTGHDADIDQMFSMQTYSINDIRANLFTLMESIQKKDKRAILLSLKDIKLGDSVFMDYKLAVGFPDQFSIGFHAASGQCAQNSFFHIEDMILSDMQLLSDDEAFANIDKFTLKKIQFPDITTYFSEFFAGADTPMQDDAIIQRLQKAFTDEPLHIEGLKIQNLTVGEANEQIKLDEGTFDLSFSLNELRSGYAIDKLTLPSSLLAEAFPEQAFFFASYAKPLNLSTKFSFDIEEKDGRIVMTSQETGLNDPDLISLSWDIQLSHAKKQEQPALVTLINDGDLFFDGFALSVTDKGLLEELTQAVVDDTQKQTGAATQPSLKEVRTTQAHLAESLISGNGKNADRITLSKYVANFIRESGTLKLKVTPKSPIRVQDMEKALRTADKLKIESSYSN